MAIPSGPGRDRAMRDGLCNVLGQTKVDLDRAQAWLDRSRIFFDTNPGADYYPCECSTCVAGRVES